MNQMDLYLVGNLKMTEARGIFILVYKHQQNFGCGMCEKEQTKERASKSTCSGKRSLELKKLYS